jgi:hypothetical protein
MKTARIFSPFQLIRGVETLLSNDCDIPSLKIAIEFLCDTSDLEEGCIHLDHLDE